jgi:hypothetical protein
MAFVSARGPFESKVVDGFYKVTPYLMARRWAVDWNPADGPEAWGDVHPRFANRAITAQVDGHAEALRTGELQDVGAGRPRRPPRLDAHAQVSEGGWSRRPLRRDDRASIIPPRLRTRKLPLTAASAVVGDA